MKTAMVPLGAGTVGLAVGLAIAAWRGDLSARESSRAALAPPTQAAQPSRAGGGLSWVADARSLRPAPASAASHASQPPLPRPSPAISGDAPVVADAGAADDSPVAGSSPATGETFESGSDLEARDRAAAHSSRSR